MSILLLCNDSQLARSVRDAVANIGLRTYIAASPDECRTLIRSARPALAVLDIADLPTECADAGLGSGIGVQGIPMVVMVTSRNLAARPRLVHSGADGIVVKPLDETALEQIVASLLFRSTCETVTLDPLDGLFTSLAGRYHSQVETIVRKLRQHRARDLEDDAVSRVEFAMWRALPSLVSWDNVSKSFVSALTESAMRGWIASASQKEWAALERSELRHAERIAGYCEAVRLGFVRGTPSSTESALESSDYLEYLTSHLPEGHVTAFLAHYRDGKTYQEIGIELGIATGTARNRALEARELVMQRAGEHRG